MNLVWMGLLTRAASANSERMMQAPTTSHRSSRCSLALELSQLWVSLAVG